MCRWRTIPDEKGTVIYEGVGGIYKAAGKKKSMSGGSSAGMSEDPLADLFKQR
jgi:hypothetical protein